MLTRTPMNRHSATPRCKHCRVRIDSARAGQVIHEECAEAWTLALIAKRQAKAEKAERVETRARREKIKTRRQWLDECQAIVNKYARLRDRNEPCISCDKPATWDGQWHGSHFRSVGAASAVRLNLWNVHKACSVCNNHLSGNIAAYRPRLVEKIGQAKVDWLESQNQLVRYEIDYLRRFKAVMGKRLRRLEKRICR